MAFVVIMAMENILFLKVLTHPFYAKNQQVKEETHGKFAIMTYSKFNVSPGNLSN
jgi:hypothetical protein